MSRAPVHRIIRDRMVESAHAARDHDAYWAKASAGWRTLDNYRVAAGRSGYVHPVTAGNLLGQLVAEGVLERHQDGQRWRLAEGVVPVGGDARMVQG